MGLEEARCHGVHASPVLDCHAAAPDKNAYNLPRVPISILGNGVDIRATRMYILWGLDGNEPYNAV